MVKELNREGHVATYCTARLPTPSQWESRIVADGGSILNSPVVGTSALPFAEDGSAYRIADTARNSGSSTALELGSEKRVRGLVIWRTRPWWRDLR